MGSVISSVIQAANDRLERQRVLEGERFMEEMERRGCVSRGQWAKPYSSFHSSQIIVFFFREPAGDLRVVILSSKEGLLQA
jgi:hypothetical protein